MMDFLYGIGIGVLFCGIGFSVYLSLKKRELNHLSDTAIHVQNGFINQRFRVHFLSRSLTNFCVQLNKILDQFQKNSVKNEKLEKIQKQMLSNISHDLRTPLTAMMGYIESILEDEAMNVVEVHQQLQIVQRKGLNLSMLLQQFFEIVKLEAEEQTLPLEKVNVSEVVKELVLLFFQSFKEKKMTPVLVFPEKPLYIWGHTPSLERIFTNIIQNALDYGCQGNEMGITVETEEQWVRIEIWDKGKGIQTEDLPFIFERLYTGNPSRNYSMQGTGLGLAITKILVEKHHGSITVTSIPDTKTTFTIHMPLEK